MMCKFLLALPIGVVLLIIGCGEGPTPPDVAPSVDYEVRGTGDTLRLTWTPVSKANGYNVYTDGTKKDCGTATSADVTGGGVQVIEVCAYTDSKEGPKWTHDFTPVITSTITVYGRSDTSSAHHSGFGFDTEGNAITYALSNSSDWPKLDFYIEDITNPDAPLPSLTSPHKNSYNTKWCGSHEESVTNFDDFDQSAAPGNYYDCQKLIIGAVYSFWLDRDNDGWDKENDRFGKIKVLSISGAAVQMKLAFQKVAGLRWVKTP